MKKIQLGLLFVIVCLVGVIWLTPQKYKVSDSKTNSIVQTTQPETIAKLVVSPTPTATPSATPSPTPKPLTFKELNALYGPCVTLPVLMYHHIQPSSEATAKKQTNLTVFDDVFDKQISTLKEKGYNFITPLDLISFFDNKTPLPSKSILITIDDGYADNFNYAFATLKKYNAKATIFLATGLMENTDYLTWSQIKEMKDSGLVYFGNHTWSHKNVATKEDTIRYEIGTANTQLEERGLDNMKVFAYPYGTTSKRDEKILAEMGFKLAFTTVSGRTQCAQKRYALQRTRVGNSFISNYGL